MADARDLGSRQMAWIDDEVEIRDLDPTLDLDVFAEAEAPAFARAPQAPEPAVPRARQDEGRPLPAVVADDQIAVPAPSHAVSTRARVVSVPPATPTEEMQALLASLRADTPRSPAGADRNEHQPEPPRWQTVPPVIDTSRQRDSIPQAIAAGVLVLVAIGGGAFLWSRDGGTPAGDGAAASAIVQSEVTDASGASPAGTAASQEPTARTVAVRTVRTPLASGTAQHGLSSSSRSPAAVHASKGSPNGRTASPVSPPASSTSSNSSQAFGRAVATTGRVDGTASPAMPSARAPRSAAPPRDASGAIAGWLRIDAPSELQLTVDGVAAGSTRQAPLLIAAGTHDVVLASDRAGVRTATRVTVTPGQVAVVPIVLPEGSLSVTAQPDADVFVDGQPAGRTPVDHVALTVGVRRILVRHPDLGERSYEVVVREGRQTELSVDLRPR